LQELSSSVSSLTTQLEAYRPVARENARLKLTVQDLKDEIEHLHRSIEALESGVESSAVETEQARKIVALEEAIAHLKTELQNLRQ